MERFKQNVKCITASVLNGVSAVCSSVVATGLTAGLSLEGLRSLGFYLNLSTPSNYS
jgi:lipid-binding SYLF domain-containing protein